MTSLLKRNSKFAYDENCYEVLGRVNNHLISAPILTCPDFDLPFMVKTDWSDYGVGAVLTQMKDYEEMVICYLSRSLTKSGRLLSTTEKECLAVLLAKGKLRPHLMGIHFTVENNHYSLKLLYNIKDQTGRLARWSVRLQQYDFYTIYRR